MLAGIIVLTGITEIGHDWLLSDWLLSDWLLNDWLLNDWLLNDWFLNDWFLNESALNDRPLDESTSTCASQPSRVNCHEPTVTSQLLRVNNVSSTRPEKDFRSRFGRLVRASAASAASAASVGR